MRAGRAATRQQYRQQRDSVEEKMRAMGLLGVAMVSFAAAQPVAADEALAVASGCTVCHQVETRLVGPSYKELAARYKAEPGAAQMLAAKVRAGSVGTWGQIPMPANTVVSDADLAAVIDWILAL